VLVLPAVASADEEVAPPARTSFGELSILLGDREVGERSTSFEGVGLGFGRRSDRYAVYARTDLGYQHGDHLAGFAGGLAVHARRTICGFRMDDGDGGMRLPCWIDLGIGWKTLFTREVLVSRPVLSLGVGGGAEAYTRRRRGGLSLGLAFELSPAKDLRAPSTEAVGFESRCSDTCPAGTRPRVDAGVLFTIAFLFAP
jgi:hypothetical protein